MLSKVMLEHGIEWEQKGTHEPHLSVLDYKKKMRSQEVKELESIVDEKSSVIENLDNDIVDKKEELYSISVDVESKKTEIKEIKSKKSKLKDINSVQTKPTLLDKKKVTIEKSDYDEVKLLAQKYIANDKKEKNLKKEIKGLKEENLELNRKYKAQKEELNEYKSVKNKLSINGLQLEVKKLQNIIDLFLEFLEMFNLRAKYEKFIEQHKRTKENTR